jgi:hypothetical protein
MVLSCARTVVPARIVTTILFLCVQAAPASLPFRLLAPDTAIHAESDSLFMLADTAQHTTVHVLRDSTGTRYFAGTSKRIALPIDSIWRSLSGMADTKPKLKYFREVQRACRPDSVECALYVEVGVAIARSWFLCDIDTLRDSLSGRRFVLFRQNHDSLLNAMVRAYPHGWITVEYDLFAIEWWLKEDGDGTRLGMYTIVDPDIWIPQWLFRVVARNVFPSMLTSFERYLKEKRPAANGDSLPDP